MGGGDGKVRGQLPQGGGGSPAIRCVTAEDDMLVALRLPPQAVQQAGEAGHAPPCGIGSTGQVGQAPQRLAFAGGRRRVSKAGLGGGRKPTAVGNQNVGQMEVGLRGGPTSL